jgi:hypothetical protein
MHLNVFYIYLINHYRTNLSIKKSVKTFLENKVLLNYINKSDGDYLKMMTVLYINKNNLEDFKIYCLFYKFYKNIKLVDIISFKEYLNNKSNMKKR